MRIELLPDRRKAFANNGFIEIPDADAGKWINTSFENNVQWVGDANWREFTGWDTENSRDTDVFDSEVTGNVNVIKAGTYLVICSMVVDRLGGSGPASGDTRIYAGGVATNWFTSHFYSRNGAVNEAHKMLYGIVELAANDDIQIYTLDTIEGTGSEGYYTGSLNSNTTQNSSFSIIRLNVNNPLCILNATTAKNHTISVSDSDQDSEWDTQTRIDTDWFDHSTSTNSDEITLKSVGKYLVVYSDNWRRSTDDSSHLSIYSRLKLNGTDVPGSWGTFYIRGSATSQSMLNGTLNAMTLIETTSANSILKLTSARETGSSNVVRQADKSSIAIYQLHGNEETFSYGSTSTENLGSTTAITPDFSSIDWEHADFSLSSDLVTVTGDKTMLIGAGVKIDSGSTNNTAPRWSLDINGTESLLYAGGGYQYPSGGVINTALNVAGIVDITSGQTIGIYNINTAAATNATDCYRESDTGRLWGINIDTL